MAAMLVEIETGLLTDKERKNPEWFPRWFSYFMSEEEKRVWKDDDSKFEFIITGAEVYSRPRYSFFSELDPQNDQT